MILTTGIFPAWSLNKFFIFFKPQYFIPGVLQKRSDLYFRYFDTICMYTKNIKIKSKCENEDDLDLFLNGPKFIENGIIIHMLLIKAIFFYKLLTRRYTFQLTKYKHESVSESIDSDDRNFSFVVLTELLFFKRSQL